MSGAADVDTTFNSAHLDDAQRLREILERHSYNAKAIVDRVDLRAVMAMQILDQPQLAYNTREKTPLDLLIRLFIGGISIPIEEARTALDDVDVWERVGAVRVRNGMVEQVVELIPYESYLFAADPSPKFGEKTRANYVMGIGNSSLLLAMGTVRRHSRRTLDLAAGGGIQSMLCSSFSDRVIATDISSRCVNFSEFTRRLNGADNVEVRRGSWFEPVAGEKFDLIVANPPFVISPATEFDFRDSGVRSDGVGALMAKEAAKYLEDGGFCHYLACWAHVRGEDWRQRVSRWFEGTDCDVWVLREDAQGVPAYASIWLHHTYRYEPAAFAENYEKWMTYYESLGVEGVGFGLVTMRKRAGTDHEIRFDEAPRRKIGLLGHDIQRGFELHDYLRSRRPQDLLHARLRVPKHVNLTQECQLGEDGWEVNKARLHRTRGLGFSAGLDMASAGMLSRCNGQRTLAEILPDVSAALGLNVEEIAPVCLDTAFQMVARGFLWPETLDDYDIPAAFAPIFGSPWHREDQ